MQICTKWVLSDLNVLVLTDYWTFQCWLLDVSVLTDECFSAGRLLNIPVLDYRTYQCWQTIVRISADRLSCVSVLTIERISADMLTDYWTNNCLVNQSSKSKSRIWLQHPLVYDGKNVACSSAMKKWYNVSSVTEQDRLFLSYINETVAVFVNNCLLVLHSTTEVFGLESP